jgi:hypothetical protein
MPGTTVLIQHMMKNQQPEINSLLSLAEVCAIPNGEQHNHIPCCFKIVAHSRGYIDIELYSSCSNDELYIAQNVVVIWVTLSQCNELAVHIVQCKVSTSWR